MSTSQLKKLAIRETIHGVYSFANQDSIPGTAEGKIEWEKSYTECDNSKN